MQQTNGKEQLIGVVAVKYRDSKCKFVKSCKKVSITQATTEELLEHNATKRSPHFILLTAE